jgi:release factor glutamine methyltransferase
VTQRSIAAALAWGEQRLAVEQRRDSAYLLRVAMQRDAVYLLAHGDESLAPDCDEKFQRMIARRQQGEPVQYIAGTQEFWGMEFLVTPDVLIPRPETEHVVEAVLARAKRDQALLIADVGTGSGAIAIALAKELPRASILATDISEAALLVARSNTEKHGMAERITLLHCNLLPVHAVFDFVVSNPPYVAEADRETLAPDVRDYEPAQALFAGDDGLAIYRRLVPKARACLKPGGWLVMELGAGQADPVQKLLAGWTSIAILRDLAGIERVICARKPFMP